MYLRGLAAELGYGMVRYDPLGLGESTQIPEETIEFKVIIFIIFIVASFVIQFLDIWTRLYIFIQNT